MKKLTQLLGISVILFSGMTTLNSCKKEKGCTDSQSLNFNSDADEDDGSCIFPADKLTGSWTVSETVMGNTTTFPATIEKKDNTTIIISSTRTNPPPYDLGTFYATVKWLDGLIENPEINIIVVPFSGTIENENDFRFNYVMGTGPYVFSVSLRYTR